jgi:uncharacterized protein (TIGR00297 family)
MHFLSAPEWLIAAGTGAALLFAYITIRRKALTPDGAVAASAVGLTVLFSAGWIWLLPLFLFFLTSTLLGRLTKRTKLQSDPKHGKPRDYKQVLSNGGIYAALAIWAPNPQILTAMAISMAVSTADTWSSELGMYFRGRTFDILRRKPVPVGLSGGVSWQGSAAGLAGALIIALLCASIQFGSLNAYYITAVTLSGFAGMLTDSILGAGFQARYRNPATGLLSDIREKGSILFSGFQPITNDAVNLISNALTTALTLLLI